MKKYVYLLAMAFIAIQFLSCSSGDDDSAIMPDSTDSSTRIQKSKIPGGGNTAPVEGRMFYIESMPEIAVVTALCTISAVNQDDSVDVYRNLGGIVSVNDGGAFSTTIDGYSLHIEGEGITYISEGFKHHHKLSLDIDDISLLESGEAVITKFSLSTSSEETPLWWTIYSTAYLAATDIPMVSGATSITNWKGGVITEYLWFSGDNSLTLVDSPDNYIEVCIVFKNGFSAKARIGNP